MKFKIFVIILLLITDYYLYSYFNSIEACRKTIQFEYKDVPILINTDDICLNNTDEFDFNNCFQIASFKNYVYKFNFNDNNLNIIFNNRNYTFPYKIIEPEVIKEVVYINNNSNSNINTNSNNEVYEDDNVDYNYFYVDSDYLSFDIDEDLNYIRQVLYANIHTTYETSIDYSNLNVSQYGQYSVFYVTELEKIEIIIEIK